MDRTGNICYLTAMLDECRATLGIQSAVNTASGSLSDWQRPCNAVLAFNNFNSSARHVETPKFRVLYDSDLHITPTDEAKSDDISV